MLVLRVGRVYDWWICHPDSVGWLRCAARCWYVRYESHRRAAASILLELGAVVEKMQSCRTNPILHLQLFLLHRNRPKTPVACMHERTRVFVHVQPCMHAAATRRLGAGP